MIHPGPGSPPRRHCVHHSSLTSNPGPSTHLSYRDSNGWGRWSSPEGKSLNAEKSGALSHNSSPWLLPSCHCHFPHYCVQQVPSILHRRKLRPAVGKHTEQKKDQNWSSGAVDGWDRSCRDEAGLSEKQSTSSEEQ